ncbi:MAG TPA: type II toxin-antitoxin system VapC family toxin [Vicinamibacterales bacterium]|nr:type II toxin-antitoxin system VapC family toxin [Vicinamibacterales bacterium]
MTAYLDTSVLVKLYVDESGADKIQQLVAKADAVVTSVVAYAEARAAFVRRRRARLMTAGETARAVRQLDADWPHLVRIPMGDELARAAGRLADTHALRGYDAVHLASFEELLARCDDEDVRFLSADEGLARAARALG